MPIVALRIVSARRMLIIRRKIDEVITIEPAEYCDTSQTIAELFASGAIEITVHEIGEKNVELAIETPPQLKISRGRSCRISDEVEART